MFPTPETEYTTIPFVKEVKENIVKNIAETIKPLLPLRTKPRPLMEELLTTSKYYSNDRFTTTTEMKN